MERQERPSRQSKNQDKWKRILQPAGDSDSSSDWSSDSENMRPDARYFGSTEHGPDSMVGLPPSNRNTFECTSVNLQPSTSANGSFQLDLRSFGLPMEGKRKRMDVTDTSTPGTSNNSHLLHHDYAAGDAYKPSVVDSYGWPCFVNRYVRPSASRKRVRFSIPNEEAVHDVTSSNGDDLDPPLSMLTSRQITVASLSETLPTAAENKRGLLPPAQTTDETNAERDPLYNVPLLKIRHKPYELSNQQRFDWTRKYSEVLNELEASTSPSTAVPTARTEDGGEVQVISMAGPSAGACPRGTMLVRPDATLQVRPDASLQVRPDASLQVRPDPTLQVRPDATLQVRPDPTLQVRQDATLQVRPDATLQVRPDASEEVIIVEDQQPAEIPVTESLAPPLTVESHSVSLMCSDEEPLNQALIGLLECPVCMEYMRPPIHQCRRGHILCSHCKPKLQACPTCRSRLSESRNLCMEKVADKLQYPCKNAPEGCSDTLRLRDKERHEANCDFRSYRCCFTGCDWKGFREHTLPHYTIKHPEKVLYGSEQTLRVQLGDSSTSTNQNWIISTLDELFRVNFITVKSQPRATLFDAGTRLQIFGCVQYIGACKKADNFKYKLESKKFDGRMWRSAIYKRATHNDVKKCIAFYSSGDSFCIRGDTADLFSERLGGETTLAVRVKVQPANEVTAIM